MFREKHRKSNDIANTIKALKVDDRSIVVKSKANSRLKLSDKLATCFCSRSSA